MMVDGENDDEEEQEEECNDGCSHLLPITIASSLWKEESKEKTGQEDGNGRESRIVVLMTHPHLHNSIL